MYRFNKHSIFQSRTHCTNHRTKCSHKGTTNNVQCTMYNNNMNERPLEDAEARPKGDETKKDEQIKTNTHVSVGS